MIIFNKMASDQRSREVFHRNQMAHRQNGTAVALMTNLTMTKARSKHVHAAFQEKRPAT